MTLDRRGSALIPRSVRLIVRVLAAILFALLPLSDEHIVTSAGLLAIVASVLTFVVILETVGKLGAVGDESRINAVLGHEEGDAIASLHRQLGPNILKPEEHPNRAALSSCELADSVDLTEQEAGEEDAGVEGEVGAVRLHRSIRADLAGLRRQAPSRAALRLRRALIVSLAF